MKTSLSPLVSPSPSLPADLPDRQFLKPLPLWMVRCGEDFADFGGQRFEKITEILNRRGKRLNVVQCLYSPFKAPLGPISSAFFTSPGQVLYIKGSKRVFVKEAA